VIALVGFMGAGKTTVGRILAAKLGVPFHDSDAIVVSAAGKEVREIFAEEGEPAFRELEREAVYEALELPEGVVALGAGALGDPGIVGQLEKHDVVHLEVAYGEAMRRIGDDPGRPMLQKDSRVLFKSRSDTYANVADLTVVTNGRDPEEIAIEIAEHFGIGPPDGFDRVRVQLGERSYDVVVGHGTAGHIGSLLPDLPGAEKAFVVTHPSLHEYASPVLTGLEGAGLEPIVFFVPEGERCKSLDEVSELYDKLAANQAHRHDVVVTFGGGAVSDCAGYVASTFARGMPLVHVPTTLLSQVDASIGGKTAVNLKSGKNLVGTIYQPTLVVTDVGFVATCPPEEIRSGLAEVVKYGFISDPGLLELVRDSMDRILGADPDVLARVVSRCAAIKAEIVSVDETESGVRAHLNYGHTFAHAIEKVNEYSGIRHGEAVAVGMMAAACLANELGLLDDDAVELHKDVLTAAGLPSTSTLELGELEEAWRLDKKYKNGVRFVLLSGIGRPETGVEAPRPALLRTLERIRS
jgi:3-dehydroquinate synthase/shikimate kinase/3-dehydroquinate synthase